MSKLTDTGKRKEQRDLNSDASGKDIDGTI